MRKFLIRYSVNPNWADENERLIAAFLKELENVATPQLRYSAARLENGNDFFHIVETDNGHLPFSSLPSYQFRASLAEGKMISGPFLREFREIGAYKG
ncbi:MAG: hypothetical protein CMK07_04200 [Ponticaulis sp.]|nr:hypothetical protein [Ponticaulis sp.]